MEEKLAAMRDLIAQKDEIDRQIAALFNGTFTAAERKPMTCGKCGKAGHTARTCKEVPAGSNG